MMKFFLTLICTLCLLSARAIEMPPALDPNFQEEPMQEEETLQPEGGFDLERASAGGASSPPSKDELAKLSFTISGEELVSLNPALEFFKPASTLACCPRKWNYGCRSSSYPMPCFYDSNVKGWCCPIAPKIYARRCSCRQCAVLTSNCVQQGYCARRYTNRWFLGVCWRNGVRPFLRSFNKPVPSSCYCRTRSTVRPISAASSALTRA